MVSEKVAIDHHHYYHDGHDEVKKNSLFRGNHDFHINQYNLSLISDHDAHRAHFLSFFPVVLTYFIFIFALLNIFSFLLHQKTK